MYSYISNGAVLALGLLSARAWADCVSYGMDFQNGGSYFQNSLSTDPFTFVSEFEGCQDDVANNILVDPNGDEYQCSDTPLTPDDTPQMSTCPLDKNQLFSGDWSVLIISNNGDADPIAYERDFSLSVGPQQTTTYTPTVTASAVVTPVVNVTSTTTDTVTTTLPPSTVTSPSTTVKPTTTVTPAAVTSTKTITLFTLHPTKWTVSVAKKTATKTASCITPIKPHTIDPVATITPTIISAAALSSKSASVSVKRRGRVDRRVPFNAEQRIAERKAKIAARRAKLGAVEKRALDQPTSTVTDTNTADYITTTTTSTASATTATVYTAVTTTLTITPAPVTVINGKTTAPVVTVTAPTPTKTKTKIAIATSWTTKTLTQTVTITTEVTPSATAAHCSAIGGTLI